MDIAGYAALHCCIQDDTRSSSGRVRELKPAEQVWRGDVINLIMDAEWIPFYLIESK